VTDFSLQLGTVAFTVDTLNSGDFGQVLQQLQFGQTARGDLPRLASVRMDTPRSFSFPAIIEADSKDEAIAMVRAANKALSVTNTLSVHTKSASESVTFRTFPSGSVRQSAVDNAWELADHQIVQVSVTVEPYAYGDLVTIVNSITAPGTVDLSDTEGEYPAPLATEVAVETVGDELHSVYLALNEHPEWDGWLTAAAGLTWTNMSASTADATAYSGFRKRTSGATRAVTAFETKDVPAGDYVVLVRAKVTGAAAGTIDIDGQTRWTATIPSGATTWRYYEVGQLALPFRVVRGTAGATMDIGLTGTGAVYIDIDQVVLLPYRAGWQSWHGATDSAGNYVTDAVYFDSDGAVYLDDVCSLVDATGSPIRALTGELIVLADEADGDTDHTHLTVTTLQTPRFSLYR